MPSSSYLCSLMSAMTYRKSVMIHHWTLPRTTRGSLRNFSEKKENIQWKWFVNKHLSYLSDEFIWLFLPAWWAAPHIQSPSHLLLWAPWQTGPTHGLNSDWNESSSFETNRIWKDLDNSLHMPPVSWLHFTAGWRANIYITFWWTKVIEDHFMHG